MQSVSLKAPEKIGNDTQNRAFASAAAAARASDVFTTLGWDLLGQLQGFRIRVLLKRAQLRVPQTSDWAPLEQLASIEGTRGGSLTVEARNLKHERPRGGNHPASMPQLFRSLLYVSIYIYIYICVYLYLYPYHGTFIGFFKSHLDLKAQGLGL